MLEWMNQLINNFGDVLMSVLPLSPFASFINSINFGKGYAQGIAWLNWFIDIPGIIKIFSLWVAAYGAYLIYSIILRWIRAIS